MKHDPTKHDPMKQDDALRSHLVRLLDWDHAHAGFDAAVEGIPAELRGVQAAGLPHSLWHLLEHMRLAQADILDFCRNPAYVQGSWPDDYWPKTVAPPTPAAWDQSLNGFRQDRDALKQLATNSSIDLFAAIPNGKGKTYLRELFLVADHNAYHLGQLVAVRQSLGIWAPS